MDISNDSHILQPSVAIETNHSEKTVPHQIPSFEHAGHTVSTNYSLEELAVPTHNTSSLLTHTNSSRGEIKDDVQSLIYTEIASYNSQVNESGQSYALSENKFASSVTRAMTTLVETLSPPVIRSCASSPCFIGVACVPTTNGHFQCGRCPFGYYGDGINCKGNVKTLCMKK